MPINKILLIQPPVLTPEGSVKRLITPLALLYLAAVLRENKYIVELLDTPCEGYENVTIENGFQKYGLSDEAIVKRINHIKPDVVGIASPFSFQKSNSFHICDLVKLVDNEITVILGGIHPSLEPEQALMHRSVDFVILGEGEERFIRFLDHLNRGCQDYDFDGIGYKKNGKPVIHPHKTRISDLDSLPLPARDLIDMHKYIDIGMSVGPFPKGDRVEQILTSRGCPFDCYFCSSSRYWNQMIELRSVDSIIHEIEHLIDHYGVNEIQFIDDNFTINQKRSTELFNRLKVYNLSWCTPNGLMVETLDRDMIRLMAKSGAYQLTFAIESGSRRILKDVIHKRVPPKEEVKRLVDTCHENGIQIHGFFVVGFPGESIDEMHETFQYPFDNDFDSLSFFIAHPAIGSPLYNECREKGYLDMSLIKGDVKSAEIIVPESSPDYVMSRKELENLVSQKTREFNEFSKAKNRDAWDKKHTRFLKRHKNQESLLLNRVT